MSRIATPTIGGLVAGLLLVWARRATVQKSTSDYMEAIVLGDGRIPAMQTLTRSASSLISIASGGSIGREGGFGGGGGGTQNLEAKPVGYGSAGGGGEDTPEADSPDRFQRRHRNVGARPAADTSAPTSSRSSSSR